MIKKLVGKGSFGVSKSLATVGGMEEMKQGQIIKCISMTETSDVFSEIWLGIQNGNNN